MFTKYGRTHADSLKEVSDSFARFSFSLNVKEAIMTRLKFELDPGHPERMQHDVNLGMVMVRSEANTLLFVWAPLHNVTG